MMPYQVFAVYETERVPGAERYAAGEGPIEIPAQLYSVFEEIVKSGVPASQVYAIFEQPTRRPSITEEPQAYAIFEQPTRKSSITEEPQAYAIFEQPTRKSSITEEPQAYAIFEQIPVSIPEVFMILLRSAQQPQ